MPVSSQRFADRSLVVDTVDVHIASQVTLIVVTHIYVIDLFLFAKVLLLVDLKCFFSFSWLLNFSV